MERTAMQELIDDIKENNRHHYEANIVWFEKLIEKEKQQIVNAFEDGREIEYQYHVNCDPVHYENVKTPEQYYNQTFKQ